MVRKEEFIKNLDAIQKCIAELASAVRDLQQAWDFTVSVQKALTQELAERIDEGVSQDFTKALKSLEDIRAKGLIKAVIRGDAVSKDVLKHILRRSRELGYIS